MTLIDSDNFITHLVWSGLVDKATCGELKEAIERCTVKDIYTKADMVDMLTDLRLEIEEIFDNRPLPCSHYQRTLFYGEVDDLILDKINALKG